jgi:hypothetical protein
MTQNEFELVDPLGEQPEPDVLDGQSAPDERHEQPEREMENLIEIW